MDPFRHCHRNSLTGLRPRPLPFLPLISSFGGGSGHRPLYPENCTSSSPTSRYSFPTCFVGLFSFPQSLDQVLDRLVSSSSKCYHSSTDDLSPGSLPGVLLLSNGTLLLEVGFTLRCLQRLSRPHFASLLCTWQYNSCTSDASTPVLSY